jgi:hypothetical protein
MSKHTPGPWTVDEEILHEGKLHVAGRSATVEAGDKGICKLIRHSQSTHDPVSEANARLIAAAPDLLAACEAALGIVADCNEYDGFPEVFAQIRTAIAKATA